MTVTIAPWLFFTAGTVFGFALGIAFVAFFAFRQFTKAQGGGTSGAESE